MGGFSASHLLIVGVIILLFGSKKLPELGAGLGQSIRAFKKAMAEDEQPLAKADVIVSKEKDVSTQS